MKKVSVILTTYNGQKTVEQTVQSILSQDGVNTEFMLELIVIDDSSEDNTVSIIESLGCRVLSTTKNSGGPNKGRNIGLIESTGDYICIADQDDVWESDKIKFLLPYLEMVPIVSSGYKVIDSNKQKEILRVNNGQNDYIFFEENETFLKRLTKSLSGQNTYLGSLIFHKKLKDVLFEEVFGAVDFDWILRLFHNQPSIEVCKSLYVRYVEGDNLSLNETYRKHDFYYALMTIEDYQYQYPKEVLQSYKRIHGSRARYYYLTGNMKSARFYFLRSEWNLKMLFYYVTSFMNSGLVKRKFNVFG